MRSKSYLTAVYALAFAACLWASSGCSTLAPAPSGAGTCKQGEPQELACLRREAAALRRQLDEAEADVAACSNLLRECESLGSER